MKVFRITKGKFIGGGEYQGRGEEVVELGELPIDKFMEWTKAAIGGAQTVEQKRSRQTVSISNDDDPRASKIREQIRASKRLR